MVFPCDILLHSTLVEEEDLVFVTKQFFLSMTAEVIIMVNVARGTISKARYQLDVCTVASAEKETLILPHIIDLSKLTASLRKGYV